MITPRYYQSEAVQSLYEFFGSGKAGNPIVAMPTGTGKSIVIGDFCKSVLQQWPGQRIIVATHVKELIQQNYNKMLEAWPEAPAGIYSAGLDQRDTIFPIIFGGIQSMVKNAAAFGHRDLLIVDEAHLISGKDDSNYGKFIAALRTINPALRVIGLSATPYRAGQGYITDGSVFTDICYDLCNLNAFNRLIDEGYICTLIPKRTNIELNVADVKIQNGDYVQHDLQEAVDKDAITYAACKEIVAQGQDRNSWLIFASGIKHAEHIAEMLRSFGISTRAVHSKMPTEERNQIISDFKSGVLRCVVNNNVLTTGFDHPAMDLIGMLRPTTSTGLWVQMLGRGTRPSPETHKTNCLVLDFAGNSKRLGPINDPVIPKKRGNKEPGTPPIKICEACGTYNHTRAVVCICCGAEFKTQSKIVTTAGTDELIKRESTAPPIIEEMTVTKVIYGRHQAKGSLPCIQVSYICGFRMVKEYVCIEHPGLAGRKAASWWKQCMTGEPPAKVDEALDVLNQLQVPRAIRVWMNRPYPEVIARLF